MKFPHYKQQDSMGCGPTCLRIISKYYKKQISQNSIEKILDTGKIGTSLNGISETAEKIGFRSLGVKINYQSLKNEAPLPCIIHWNQNHFVVVYKIKKDTIYISDPAQGLIKYKKKDFLINWTGQLSEESKEGITLLLEPTDNFYKQEWEKEKTRGNFKFLLSHFLRYKKFVVQLIIGLVTASFLQLIFPFLTQSIVDIGIQNQDINFIYLILLAQLFLFFGTIGIEFIRNWILLHLSTRISISLVSDFFVKLMKLPISFFDARMTGDIMQRINDHQRIERFITISSLNTIFSFLNLIIYSFVLAWYSIAIFTVFLVGSIFYLSWIILFLKRRKNLDHLRFTRMGEERNKIIELVNGMQEIKLNNAERQKRWSWEYLQARLFKIEMKNLVLEQSQKAGSRSINELKNILITVLAAKLVLSGEITLGMMLSISYILGQLNSPLYLLVDFIRSFQDANISLERLSEIHEKEDEEQNLESKINYIPKEGDFNLRDVTYIYPGTNQPVIHNLNLIIPANKTTAIVGSSGSGKTTIMKLLLNFYTPTSGSIKFNNVEIKNIYPAVWRSNIGVVMQEGYIFNDSIANNISIGEEGRINKERLFYAADIANIREFIEQLPLGYNTKIGGTGMGISTGQKQRILIARAVYKDPKILFFDEATSALDANNEKTIINNLTEFLKSRTSIIIAHRLSTIKNADKILVMEEGKIIEEGNHESLILTKGRYYDLMKNQLEMETLFA